MREMGAGARTTHGYDGIRNTVQARQSQELSSKHPLACLGLRRHAGTNAEEADRGEIGEEFRSREGRDDRGRHIPARSGRRLTSGTDPTESGARRGARHAHSSSLPQTRSHQPGKTWLPRSRTPRERAEEVLCACLAGQEVPPSPSLTGSPSGAAGDLMYV